MKLTQALKNWLHKMFAWWPWKQSTQIEYSHYANSVNNGTNQETISRSMNDGISPQSGIVPRLSTVEEWPERIISSDVGAKNDLTETASLSLILSSDEDTTKKSATPVDSTRADAQISPSAQQRLEFLQYLIKRGIVNEGVEEDK